jgi:hypothetical protein
VADVRCTTAGNEEKKYRAAINDPISRVSAELHFKASNKVRKRRNLKKKEKGIYLMNEDVLAAVVGSDEAPSFGDVEPLALASPQASNRS